MAKKLTYTDAGVDIETGDEIAHRVSAMAKTTFSPEVIDTKGGFAGAFYVGNGSYLFSKGCKNPVIVACTDGVGTKLAVADAVDKHDTVGIDLVAMSVNDLLCTGAEPLFFLDYIAASKLSAQKMLKVLEGVVKGCRIAGCALLGGETAEMPGFYNDGLYDLAGFAVGIVDKRRMLPVKPRKGDLLVGVASAGVHSNGYSLVREVIRRKKIDYDRYIEELGCTLGEELLKPTRIYTEAVRRVLSAYKVKKAVRAICHITGGGLPGNVVRALPDGFCARIRNGSWPVPPVFRLLQKWGNIEEEEMFRVFNMGVGLVMIVAPAFANAVLRRIREAGIDAWIIGEVCKGKRGVRIT